MNKLYKQSNRRKYQRRQVNRREEDNAKEEKITMLKSLIMGLIVVVIMILFYAIAHGEEVDMNRIKMIESSGNPMAYNEGSQARGLYQITPICLADYNKYHEENIHLNQLFIPEQNFKVANWYMNK